jgi:UDP-2,4-diacetamido-2,4,6-trideoxy-beta-L-altropyranose hydrolase
VKVLVRADASQAIGSGHVARCLSLANALRAQGGEVLFACRELPGHCLPLIAAQGFTSCALPPRYAGEVVGQRIEAALPWEQDIAALQRLLPSAAAFDWVLVDHYGLDARWEQAAHRWAPRVAAIDDLGNRAHQVELLLDQNLTASAAAYEPWLAEPCQTLFGPGFALLRDEFADTQARAVPAKVQRVLVNFGGMDAAGQCWKAMQALQAFPELQVDFVAGAGNPDWAALQTLAATRPQWRLYARSEQFGQLMAAADLFIGAAGGTTWERAAMGLPTVCMAVAANQQANAELMAAAGAHVYLGPCQQVDVAALATAITALLDDPPRRRQLAETSRRLVDGHGAQRVATYFSAPAPAAAHCKDTPHA